MFGASSGATTIAVIVIAAVGFLVFLVDRVFTDKPSHRRK